MIALDGLNLQIPANTLGLDSVFILCLSLSVIREVYECEQTNRKKAESVSNIA